MGAVKKVDNDITPCEISLAVGQDPFPLPRDPGSDLRKSAQAVTVRGDHPGLLGYLYSAYN